ncbi:MAG: XdhC family protein [Ruegeria sp.]
MVFRLSIAAALPGYGGIAGRALSQAPRLVIYGVTPMAHALARLRVSVTYDFDRAAPHTSFDPEAVDTVGIEARDFVVVASQGQNDRLALAAAQGTDARRVSMVASRREAQSSTDRLVAQGMDTEQVARLRLPAELNVGAIDPHQIALSILTEIVRWRNTDAAKETTHDEKLA